MPYETHQHEMPALPVADPVPVVPSTAQGTRARQRLTPAMLPAPNPKTDAWMHLQNSAHSLSPEARCPIQILPKASFIVSSFPSHSFFLKIKPHYEISGQDTMPYGCGGQTGATMLGYKRCQRICCNLPPWDVKSRRIFDRYINAVQHPNYA